MNNSYGNNIRDNTASTFTSTSSENTVVHIDKCHKKKRTLRKTKSNSGVCNSEHSENKGRGRRQYKMMDALGALYLLFHVSRIRSEGVLLRLHVLTAALMLTFSIIVSTKQAVGNPIDCVHTRDIPVEVFNTYCWIHSTYFVTGAMLGVAGVNVAFPGVASSGFILSKQRNQHENQQTSTRHRDDAGMKQVKYYQWVAFVLIFQAHSVEMVEKLFEKIQSLFTVPASVELNGKEKNKREQKKKTVGGKITHANAVHTVVPT